MKLIIAIFALLLMTSLAAAQSTTPIYAVMQCNGRGNCDLFPHWGGWSRSECVEAATVSANRQQLAEKEGRVVPGYTFRCAQLQVPTWQEVR